MLSMDVEYTEGIRDLGFGIRDSGFGVRRSAFGVRRSGSRFGVRGAGSGSLRSLRVENLDRDPRDPESRVPSPDSRIPNPYTVSTSLPMCVLDSMTRCASAASRSGKVANTTGFTAPDSRSGQTFA